MKREQQTARAYLDRRGETARVLGGRHDQLVDVRLAEILKVEILGQTHVARRRSDVERAGALALRLEGVADLALGERFRPHRDDAATRHAIATLSTSIQPLPNLT